MIMVDLLKLRTSNNLIINKLLIHPDFLECKPINNYYTSLKQKDGFKIGLHFRKAIEKGFTIGYGYVDVLVSPHYHKNNYQHNGDDFTPLECIKSINEILDYLEIEKEARKELQVVNIEFGLNIIPNSDAQLIFDGLLLYKRSKFSIKYDDIETFKISEATKYKEIKAYLKGLQFLDYPAYNIDKNTLRFEVRSKESKKIKSLGIYSIYDLLKIEIYEMLFKELLSEWDLVLLVNLQIDKSQIKEKDIAFLDDCNSLEYWEDLMNSKHRNTYLINKKKYFKILLIKNNFHTEIKAKMTEKINIFFNVQIPHREPA
ncbi:hypothetical protein GCM10010984_07420 [Chishuiella changwenlii]|uniref:Uncharacterized protein n=2 Tax=Chishuiella changwenlii TaxID=1434701 RepID=A0ABQ1TDQ7_9FLAO|nr:hypothetical protein GCM10010984_07420 [Chishuiella changwenlii]